MHRARPGTGEDGKGARQNLRQLFGLHQRMAEGGDTGDDIALVGQLMQPALAHAQLIARIDAGDHQHGNRIAIGLAHGGQDVGHARAGDDETHAGLAGDPGIAIGHESGTLFVARRDVADARLGQAAIELDGMYARNAEDELDAIGLEQLDQQFAASCHDER